MVYININRTDILQADRKGSEAMWLDVLIFHHGLRTALLDLGCASCQGQHIKENYYMVTIKSQSYTEEQIIQCLATCESVISKNAYLEKKWSTYIIGNCSRADEYTNIRTDWMEYRKKLRSLLLDKYSMKEIIQKTKSCERKSTQKRVKEIIDLLD